MANRKKAFRIVGLAADILILGGVVALVVLSIDDPPPDVAGLRVKRLDIPPAENGFVILGQAVAKLDLNLDAPAADDKPQAKLEQFDRMGRGQEWDAALAEEVLARNAEALALWEKTMAAPHFQGPEVRSMDDVRAPTYPWLDFAGLVCVRAQARAKQGHGAAAFDDLVSVLRLGHRVEQSKGHAVTWLVGYAIKDRGYSLMRQMLPEAALTPQQLRAYARQIAAFPADAGGYADAFRNEYTVQAGMIDGMVSGETPASSTTGETFEGVARWFRRTVYKPFIKPNRTKALLAEIARGRGDNGLKHFKDAFKYVFDDEKSVLGADKRNLLGAVLARVLAGSGDGMPAIKCHENVGLAVTRLFLAAKAYRVEKGRLPERLDQLVPDYLDSVPVDDFDGKPLRYNAAKKIIYSVGKDLRDDGGMTKKEYVDFRVKQSAIDPKYIGPEELKSYENEYPGQGPNPSFPIDF